MIFRINAPSSPIFADAVTHIPNATPAWGSSVIPKYFLIVSSHPAAAALIYALAATGRMGGMWDKFKRSISELTGGSAGKRK